MRARIGVLVILAVLVVSAVALLSQARKPSQNGAATRTDGTPPQTPNFDISALDRSADPCNDFYQYACGTWMKNNPIPSDQARWGRFNELVERNRVVLREILEDASAHPERSQVSKKIGDYYASCMDEPAINKEGIAALKPELNQIAALKSKDQLPTLIADLHRSGVNAFFGFGSDQDFKDATQEIAEVDQGGLGLPDRDYYVNDDAHSKELRAQYVQHVTNMFQLMGEAPAQAAKDAATVMQLETELARSSMERVKRRQPENVYHKMSEQQLQQLAPAFAWNRYFVAAGTPVDVQSLNVAVPDFFKGFNQVLQTADLNSVKTYLRWQLAHLSAPMLPKPFVDENFDFYGKKLIGQKELQARWKRCVSYTDADLGEALGQSYVERTFGASGKERTLAMVHELEDALRADVKQLDWMTDTTRKQAIEKLEAMANKIGYPDKWRDYSSLKVQRGDALGNWMRSNAFEFQRQLNKIGKPVDRKEWDMSPPTVNAYYNPQMNDINFPAGILQPPFFSGNADAPLNYGGIGAVIGHEMTHGFDDQGSQFDAKGNLRDWWTAQDAKQFKERTQCVANEYSQFEPLPGDHINGELTLGENTADNGGVRLALMALNSELGNKEQEKIDGFTPEQRFFLAFGQIWCENQSEQSIRLRLKTDPHSPGRYRVNGVVRNMPEFQKAFGCKAQAKMVPENRCRVW